MRISDWSSDVCSSVRFGERALGDQLRLHPMRIPRGRSGHLHRRRLALQRFELALETFHFIIAETGADLACIAHPPTLVEPEQQRSEGRRVGTECVSRW